MTRFTAPLIALLLCGTALTGCASDKPSTLGVPKNTAAAANAATPVSDAPALPTDIESNVRQAQAQRLTGHYDEAIHTLSQLMLVASDDPRVVGEYGKTLTEKGRAQDAVQFLTRATELQPVRRQNIWRSRWVGLVEHRPRLGVDVKRRGCGVASVDVRWSVALSFLVDG